MDNYIDPSEVCQSSNFSSLEQVCAGCNFDGSNEQYENWISSNCPLVYSSYFFDNNNTYSPQNSNIARELANSLLTKYQQYNPITDSSDSDFNPFQNVLHSFCNEYGIYPGVCQNYLTNKYCTDSITSDSGSNYISWCGCDYRRGDSCSSACNSSNTIKRVNTLTGQVSLCDKNICIIDNISVTIANSNTQGVTINQICPTCVSDCICLIENVDTEGSDIDINQYCGSQVICYNEDSDGNITEVQCPQPNSISRNVGIIAIVVIILFVALVIVLVVVMRK